MKFILIAAIPSTHFTLKISHTPAHRFPMACAKIAIAKRFFMFDFYHSGNSATLLNGFKEEFIFMHDIRVRKGVC